MPTTQKTQQIEMVIATSLDELLALYDEPFIQCAYWTLLGRSPDLGGLSHYLTLIRRGEPKIKILTYLALSVEGRRFAHPEITGLSAAIRRFRLSRLPVIGPILRVIGLGWKDVPIEQKLRLIENQLFMVSDATHKRLTSVEKENSALQNLISQSQHEARYTENLSTRGNRIYWQLQTAMSKDATTKSF